MPNRYSFGGPSNCSNDQTEPEYINITIVTMSSKTCALFYNNYVNIIFTIFGLTGGVNFRCSINVQSIALK